jgi:anti-sigma B factor antagonist
MVEVPEFALQVTHDGQGPVVRVAGELDLASAGQFRECLQELMGRTLTIDFTDVTFMDSTALGVLIAAQQRQEVEGGELILHGVRPAQMRVIEIAGLAEVFNVDGDSGRRS